MGSKIFKSMILLCFSMLVVYANSNGLNVKKYTTEPNFSNMPRNIVESYRFVWDEYDYIEYIRISKMIQKGKTMYQIDGAYDSAYKGKRYRARITEREWNTLKSSIEYILSYDYLGAKDERRIYDIGTVGTEIYRDKKNCYMERYDSVGNKDDDQLHDYFKMISQVYKFYYKNIVKNKHREKHVYDLQKELDERENTEEEKRRKKYELEAKKEQAIYESERLWHSANTGGLGGIGYFKDMNTNIVNSKGQTPLMVAVQNGYVDVVRNMAEAKVKVHKKDYMGKTAFDYIQTPTTKEELIYSKRMYGALRVLEVEQLIKGYAKIVSYKYENDIDSLTILIRGETCYRFKFPKNTKCKEMPKPKKVSHEIFETIKFKNHEKFDALLNEVELNITNRHGYSLLWAGIHYKNLYVVDKVLKKGIDINQLDDNKLHKPISWAIIHNEVGLLQVLLNNGVDVNSKGKFGSPILFKAMYKCKSFETISLLLSNGANPYLKDKYGKTVFEKEPVFCKDKTNIEKMKKLLHSQDKKGLKVQAVALNKKARIAYEEEDILRKNKKFDTYLSTLSDVNVVDSAGFTPLHKAVATKDYYAIKKLINKGANINMLDGKYGEWTPFNYTIAMQDIKALKIFLDNGADVNFFHKGKSTVLNDAIRSCNLDMVKLLLNHGANPRLKDGYNGTVENSLDKCDEEVKKKVLALVQNIIIGKTNNMLQVVDKIEFQSTSENRKNKEKIEKIKAYVKEKKNAVNPIFVAIRYKSNIDFDKFLKTVKDIGLENEQGDTLLYVAVEARNYHAIKKLIAQGANMNYTKEYRTYTPFSYAVALSDTKAVKLFVDKGVNVNYQYKKSLTNLSLAVKQCNIDIIKLLLDSGADIALEDKRGDNAIKSLGFCNNKDNKTIKKLILGD